MFCALATGNVLFLSFGLAGEGDVPVARPAAAAGAFVAGCVIGVPALTALVAPGRPWSVAGPAGEGLLLVASGAVAFGRYGLAKAVDHTDYVVIGGVALAMGLRASTALRMHVPGMPTPLSQTAMAELVDDGGVLGTWVLVPLGPGRALIVIGAAVLVCAAASHAAGVRREGARAQG
ncbi:DUF1275 family protein [Streptomyces pseudogriseolus]|uniref:DUF1275 family protein n=1 Tax=Streptomyces pseudogriseolus TaxID=36817 RepID=UPI003FA2C43B